MSKYDLTQFVDANEKERRSLFLAKLYEEYYGQLILSEGNELKVKRKRKSSKKPAVEAKKQKPKYVKPGPTVKAETTSEAVKKPKVTQSKQKQTASKKLF